MPAAFTKRKAIIAVVVLNVSVLAMHREVTVKGVVMLTLISAMLLMPQLREDS